MARKIYSSEEVQARLDSLPEDIKKSIYSADMAASIQRIGTKNQLHIDQVALLEAEAGEVMLGFTESTEFVPNLMKTLDIDRTKAATIAQDVSEQLFAKIRESMKQNYEQSREVKLKPQSESIKTALPLQKTTPATPPPPPPAPPAPPKTVQTPAKPAAPHPADMMLAQKTVSIAPAAPVLPIPPKPAPPVAPSTPKPATPPPTPPPAPKPYTADPYREPAE